MTKRELKNRIAELEQELAAYKRASVNRPRPQYKPKTDAERHRERAEIGDAQYHIENNITRRIQRGII